VYDKDNNSVIPDSDEFVDMFQSYVEFIHPMLNNCTSLLRELNIPKLSEVVYAEPLVAGTPMVEIELTRKYRVCVLWVMKMTKKTLNSSELSSFDKARKPIPVRLTISDFAQVGCLHLP
jgi:hypothetical protein